ERLGCCIERLVDSECPPRQSTDGRQRAVSGRFAFLHGIAHEARGFRARERARIVLAGRRGLGGDVADEGGLRVLQDLRILGALERGAVGGLRKSAHPPVKAAHHQECDERQHREAALGIPVAKTGPHLVGLTSISPFGPRTSRISPVPRSSTWPGLSEKRTAPSPTGTETRPSRRPDSMRGASVPSTPSDSPFTQTVDGPPERRT